MELGTVFGLVVVAVHVVVVIVLVVVVVVVVVMVVGFGMSTAGDFGVVGEARERIALGLFDMLVGLAWAVLLYAPKPITKHKGNARKLQGVSKRSCACAFGCPILRPNQHQK